jgi:hypothetical protein
MVRLRRFVTFVRLAGFVSCHHVIGLLSLGI